ncbi:MAG: 3'-5' exonuclease [Planctomycetota bacterium]|nr:3'-5' exonuclease [Planctomycetales bacterium]RLT02745.1 MAG: 3'-5' exonuclease [Planctomycetota bacterium]
MSDVKFLIFDIETVGDGDLIQKIRFPEQVLTPREAVNRYRQQLLDETGKDVLPLTFVLPVSVAIAKVAADYRLLELTVLDSPAFRPQEIVRRFWQGWQHYQRPTLVTFNGRGYDMPVMEVSAFRFGLSIPAWFNVDSRAFEQSRNRYNHDAHLDLQDLLTNFGSFRMHGGLNLLANLIDKPGKAGIDGSQVQDLYHAGHVDRINDYCRCDVLDTYFVFLRSRVLLGKLTLQEELTLTEMTRDLLSEQAENHPAYEHYLKTWDFRGQQKMDVMQSIGVPIVEKMTEDRSTVVAADPA